ncbi:glutaredoxin domain-containing protein [Streptomyces finlayi]|nr:glutaredoxin domain-containing protein [Streptomyces finlayi]
MADRTGHGYSSDDEGMVVYWRPGCPYCMKLRLRLRFCGLTYTEVNIWRNPDAAAFVRSVADGHETVPTVTIAGQALVNPSKRQITDAVRSRAPHLLRGAKNL